MLLVRITAGLAIGYAFLLVLAWLFQERLAFPAPRAPVPDPKGLGISNCERIEVKMKDGTRLAGWYLSPRAVEGGEGRWKAAEDRADSTALNRPPPPSPAVLGVYGKGENVASV